MIPAFAPGERLVVRYGAPFKVGDAVLVDRGERLDLKRVTRVDGRHIVVEGDNSGASTDSRHYGAVTAEAIVAVVQWRLPAWVSALLPTAG